MRLAELDRWLPFLERHLERSYRRAMRAAPIVEPELDAAREFTLRGGKRFRALLVLAGFTIAAHRPPRPALSAAAALEHFQSWMLLHDDVIDHAETRRGGPTLHRWAERSHADHRWNGDPAGYGVGVAITLGDLEEPSTVAELLDAPVSPERRLAALAEYRRMAHDTACGQLLDLRCGVRPAGEVTEEDVLTVHRLKSAVYTVASPLRIGAILGGGRPALLRDLEAIGLDLGIAFQLRDDVLGTGFDSDASGKSANDLTEGKRTLLVIRAYAASDAAGRAELEAVLGRPEATPEELRRARERIRTSGSLDYTESRIHALTQRALARVGRARTLRAGDRELLREIADRLVRRDR